MRLFPFEKLTIRRFIFSIYLPKPGISTRKTPALRYLSTRALGNVYTRSGLSGFNPMGCPQGGGDRITVRSVIIIVHKNDCTPSLIQEEELSVSDEKRIVWTLIRLHVKCARSDLGTPWSQDPILSTLGSETFKGLTKIE